MSTAYREIAYGLLALVAAIWTTRMGITSDLPLPSGPIYVMALVFAAIGVDNLIRGVRVIVATLQARGKADGQSDV